MPKSLRLANELTNELDGKHWTVFKCQPWCPRPDLWDLWEPLENQQWKIPTGGLTPPRMPTRSMTKKS